MEREQKILLGIIIVWAGFVILMIGNGVYSMMNTETIIVRGEVEKVETVLNDNNNIEYIIITINGEDYPIKYFYERGGSITDFTVNSEAVIEMHMPDYLWDIGNDNGYWNINHMLKVPD